MYHCHKEYLSLTEKNILQHQRFIESYAELLEPIPIPSSVMMFVVIHSLILMRLQNCSINYGKW